MLWESTAQEVTQQMLEDALRKTSQDRKAEYEKRLAYYYDEHESYTDEALAEYYSDPSWFTATFFNVTKKIVNQLSMTYIADAKREVEGTDQDKEIYAEIVQSSMLNVKMKTCSRYTKLLKTVLLKPVWRNGRMDVDILAPDILDVLYGDRRGY